MPCTSGGNCVCSIHPAYFLHLIPIRQSKNGGKRWNEHQNPTNFTRPELAQGFGGNEKPNDSNPRALAFPRRNISSHRTPGPRWCSSALSDVTAQSAQARSVLRTCANVAGQAKPARMIPHTCAITYVHATALCFRTAMQGAECGPAVNPAVSRDQRSARLCLRPPVYGCCKTARICRRPGVRDPFSVQRSCTAAYICSLQIVVRTLEHLRPHRAHTYVPVGPHLGHILPAGFGLSGGKSHTADATARARSHSSPRVRPHSVRRAPHGQTGPARTRACAPHLGGGVGM